MLRRLPLKTVRAAASAALLALAGCATVPPSPPAGDWQHVLLPGKRPTQYAWVHKEGRPAVLATADRSASMWRRRLEVPLQPLGRVEFSWWVDRLIEGSNVAAADTEDAPARVIFAFDGDHATLSPRNRMLFDLAQTLSGERPPYATLMYVWEASAPLESVIVNPRSDRIRKIVVDSGPQQLRRWRVHQRDLVADYRRAFGEDPGPLLAVALMTDSDNTGTRAAAWYGPVELVGR